METEDFEAGSITLALGAPLVHVVGQAITSLAEQGAFQSSSKLSLARRGAIVFAAPASQYLQTCVPAVADGPLLTLTFRRVVDGLHAHLAQRREALEEGEEEAAAASRNRGLPGRAGAAAPGPGPGPGPGTQWPPGGMAAPALWR